MLVKSAGRNENGSGCGGKDGGNWCSNGRRVGAASASGIGSAPASSSSSSTRIRFLVDACREKGTSGELSTSSDAAAGDVMDDVAPDAPGGFAGIEEAALEETSRFEVEAEADCTEGDCMEDVTLPEAPEEEAAAAAAAMSGSTSALGTADDWNGVVPAVSSSGATNFGMMRRLPFGRRTSCCTEGPATGAPVAAVCVCADSGPDAVEAEGSSEPSDARASGTVETGVALAFGRSRAGATPLALGSGFGGGGAAAAGRRGEGSGSACRRPRHVSCASVGQFGV